MENRFKLLYVDDEVDNLSVFKAAFSKEFDVVTMESPLEAKELCDKVKFEIIVVDQRMPELTGIEFLNQIRDSQKESVKILLTGYSEYQVAIDAINKCKVFYYCTKPWKKNDLKIVLLKAMDFFELNRNNQYLVEKLTVTLKELEVFLYRASHDLRSPITTQIGLLKLLQEEVVGNARNYLDKIEETIFKLEQTAEKISELSRMGYDFLSGNLSVNVSDIVKDVLTEYDDQLRSQRIEVALNDQTKLEFLVQREPMMTVLRQIIDNAVQFVRPQELNKRIEIDLTPNSENTQINIRISDNGSGIEQRHMDRIFDPFFRGTALSKGNGLGLYIVKKVCDLLKWDISFYSNGEDRTVVNILATNSTVLL
ncbi:MAG: hybrid sensor histidine kinase/response regulator [Cyclobacteriaceae bacterium]|nr:hybrid sensor histidine kinase/response regulator [Cyclobacteriaceae bacterium]